MHIIFDLDGTLIDSRKGIIRSLNYAISIVLKKEINIDVSYIGPPVALMIKNIIPCISDENASKIENIFRNHYNSIGWSRYKLYPKVLDTLMIVKKSNSVSIATNKPVEPTTKILKHANIFNFFDKIICYEIDKYENKSEMLSAILKYKFDKRYLMVGDSNDDYIAAFSNSISFLQCEYGYGKETIKNNEIKKINNFYEILTELKC